jgi:hypothetical protein
LKPCVDDTFCGKNNIVAVKKSDFEVMEALTMDSIQQQALKLSTSRSINLLFRLIFVSTFFLNLFWICFEDDDLGGLQGGEYTDEIPVRGLSSLTTDKPPYLPPQLLNIVLNKDTSASVCCCLLDFLSDAFYGYFIFQCEPALLPEPNHVMLKHLYALSIKVGFFSYQHLEQFFFLHIFFFVCLRTV